MKEYGVSAEDAARSLTRTTKTRSLADYQIGLIANQIHFMYLCNLSGRESDKILRRLLALTTGAAIAYLYLQWYNN